MSIHRASTPALVALAGLALVSYALAERSLTPVHASAYRTKLRAVNIMKSAEHTIAAVKKERGIGLDLRNDPQRCGVIGPQFSLTTTDRGSQAAKMLAAQPEFAAAVTQMMLEAGVRRGDLVAAGMTGSLPGFNLAVLSACQAIGAEPVIFTSLGSSMFGATDPQLTWLDMESVLAARGVWPYRTVAASLGGGGDVGRGLSPTGRALLIEAIQRNQVPFIAPANMFESVRRRVAMFDSIAAARGKRFALYVNVGAGVASLGGKQNTRLIPAGLTRRLATRRYPDRGVINVFGERDIPVLNLLHVEKLARQFRIAPPEPGATRSEGSLLFIKYRYNLWIVSAAAALVMIANLFVLRLDLRQRLLGQPHPEAAARPLPPERISLP